MKRPAPGAHARVAGEGDAARGRRRARGAAPLREPPIRGLRAAARPRRRCPAAEAFTTAP
ncbi:hypothetical protein AQ905_14105 [Burkholderia pseudomallei]|nr:hypothetical protein AQ905_14105 [Burkholderia pseudomallei]